MKDLMKEFFKRDLTDGEEEELAKQLASSPENSMRFAKHAKQFYLKTGLPNPVHSLGNTGLSGTMTLKIVGGILIGGAVVVTTLHVVNKPVERPLPTPVPTVITLSQPKPVDTIVVTAPTPTAIPFTPTVFTAPRSPGMVKPIAYDPRIKYEGLDLIVERETPGLVTIRVLNSSKKEVRLLFAGFLEKGKWTFQWDGKIANNDFAQPGTYLVEVQSGKEILTKEITLQSETVTTQKP